MAIRDNSLENTVIRFTLGISFIGVTVLFIWKTAVLIFTAIKTKLATFIHWITSGQFLKDLGSAIWDSIFGG